MRHRCFSSWFAPWLFVGSVYLLLASPPVGAAQFATPATLLNGVTATASAGPDSVSEASFLRVRNQSLVLRKSFLGHRLLLLPAMAESTIRSPSLNSARLVHFSRVGSTLQLILEQEGRTMRTMDLTGLTLASFAIESEDTETLTFRFAANALHDFFVAMLSNESAKSKEWIGGTPPWPRVTGAYVQASVAGPNWVSVEQVISYLITNGVDEQGTVALDAELHRVVMRFTFWDPEESTYVTKEDLVNDHFGYFNTTWRVPGVAAPRRLARRFDPSRPVTFYLSANTPLQYRQTIRDAVLQWNTVLGENFLHIADAPPSVRAGDPRYPLILWLEDTTIDYAFGSAQASPLTGQVLTALILLPTGRFSPRWVDYQNPALPDAATSDYEAVGLSDTLLCAERRASGGWLDIAATSADGRRDEQIVLWELKNVVTHEIGHVLGLRHNFAASLDSQIALAEDDADFTAWLAGTRATDAAQPSSSIMEYLSLRDTVRMTAPGVYDWLAVANLYDRPLPQPEWADVPFHFCTDDDAFTDTTDCQKFDGGRDTVQWWGREVDRYATILSQRLADVAMSEPSFLDRPTKNPPLQNAAWRIQQALAALLEYAQGKGWAVNNRLPFEAAEQATAVLKRVVPRSTPDLKSSLANHPLVAEPLRSQVLAWEAAQRGTDTDARLATQRLKNIRIVLDTCYSEEVLQFVGNTTAAE
ncbi:MAG: zinc-dependent metalloprotease [Deltaproteobacteria bacterium]|nr:zinc-dependent metalloprotease [Deltaproteobacteria bacterium]